MQNYVIPPRTEDPKELSAFFEQVCLYINTAMSRVSAADADSTAGTVGDLKTDFNDLLAKLRTAGLLNE